ncbi:MAG: exosortase/archaeosortase family protein [Candidatus Omnitrophota bacterium]
MIKIYWKKLIVISAFVLIAYIPAFIWMYDRWAAADSYYSHGFLVPLISLFIVWRMRCQLQAIKIAPDNRGWWLFGLGIAAHMLSSLWQVYFTSGFSLLFVIAGLVLIFGGKAFLRALRFPILFLISMLPLPMAVIAEMSFRLKLIAAQMAAFAVNHIGMAAVREGSVIKTAHSYLVVEDPCSGIRSLIALISLGALMAYFSKLPRVKKMIVFASSLPIAIFANVLRIIVLTLASEMYGSEFATGAFHDAMGFAVFAISFFSLVLVSKSLE